MVYLAELGEIDVFWWIPDKGRHANLYGDQLVEVGSNVRHTGRRGTMGRGKERKNGGWYLKAQR